MLDSDIPMKVFDQKEWHVNFISFCDISKKSLRYFLIVAKFCVDYYRWVFFFLHVHVLCIEIFNIVLIKWMPYDFPKLQWRLYTGNIIRYVSVHILIKYEVMLPCVTIWMLIFETCETRGIKRSTHMYDYFVILLLKLNIIKICSTIFFTAWSALRGA